MRTIPLIRHSRALAFAAMAVAAGATASPGLAASCPAGSTNVGTDVCEVQYTTAGQATWSAPSDAGAIEAVVVGGGGAGSYFDWNGSNPSKTGMGGGGGAVEIATLTGASQVTVDVGGAASPSSVTPDVGAATTAQAGQVGAITGINAFRGGTSGSGRLGRAYAGSYGVGGGGASAATTTTAGGAGVTVSSAVSAGSLFAGDPRCFGGGGAGANALWGVGGATASGGCGGGSATWDGSSYTFAAPTANSGGGGIGGHGVTDWSGAGGTVIIRFQVGVDHSVTPAPAPPSATTPPPAPTPVATPVAQLATPVTSRRRAGVLRHTFNVAFGQSGRFTFLFERTSATGAVTRVRVLRGSRVGTRMVRRASTAIVVRGVAGRGVTIHTVGAIPNGTVLRVVFRNADGTLQNINLPAFG